MREHLGYLVSLLVQPAFKQIVNWLTLTPECVTMDEAAFEVPGVRNFVILTALKVQQLIGDLKESQAVNEALTQKHQASKENELKFEIELATLKDAHEQELATLKT